MRILTLALLLLLSGFVVAGCESDPMREGIRALVAENPDEAEAAFKKVLAKSPDNLEAQRQMVEVHVLRKDFERALEEIEKIQTSQGLDKEASELSSDQRALQRLLDAQYVEMHQRWLESLDPKESPETFVAVAKRALEKDPRSNRINSLLVGHYMEQADRLIEAGDKLAAAKNYEEVLQLRAMPAQRQQAQERSGNLRFEAYSDDVEKHFNEKLRPQLEEEELWDAEARAIIVRVEREVDNRLRPNNDEHRQQAREQATAAIQPALMQAIRLVNNFPEDASLANATVPEMQVVGEDFVRGRYLIVLSISLTELIRSGYAVHEANRKAGESESTPLAAESPEQAVEEDGGSDEEPAEE